MIETAITVFIWGCAALLFVAAAIPLLMMIVVFLSWVVVGILYVGTWIFEQFRDRFIG